MHHFLPLSHLLLLFPLPSLISLGLRDPVCDADLLVFPGRGQRGAVHEEDLLQTAAALLHSPGHWHPVLQRPVSAHSWGNILDSFIKKREIINISFKKKMGRNRLMKAHFTSSYLLLWGVSSVLLDRPLVLTQWLTSTSPSLQWYSEVFTSSSLLKKSSKSYSDRNME